jgi:EAL domain-containing protein (putative c-di-GMP-specific phosphodiesterase class I)
METGDIVGAEALARWVQPDGRVLPPAAFLRALTEAGLDTDLGIHMALQIMSFRCGVAEVVPESFRVGLNVTLRRTRAKDLVDSLAAMQPMLTPTGASVIEGMTIELTENVAVRDLDEMQIELARARSLGLAVALDDFGTGHSSLTLVRRLPLDTIKIDRCFVDGVATDRASQAVVSAVVELAAGIGASVVAEGVEQLDDAARLRSLGCRLAQGFLYSAAVPAETLRSWLVDGAPWQQRGLEAAGVSTASLARQGVTPR